MAPSEPIKAALHDVFGKDLLPYVAAFVPAPDLSYQRGVELLEKLFGLNERRWAQCHFEESIGGATSVKIEGAMNWEDFQRVLYPYPHTGSVPAEHYYEFVNSLCEELEVKFTAKQGKSSVMVEGSGDPYVYDGYHERYYVLLLVVVDRPFGRR